MKKIHLLSILAGMLLMTAGDLSAQGKYGADSASCVANISLYREFYQQKSYKDAYPYWRMVFNDCPASTEHMYADGPVLLRWAMQQEKDPAKQEFYKDSILAVYDQRIVHFGKEGYVLGRKMMEMVSLYPEKQEEIYEMGKRAHALEGNNLDAGAAFLWWQSAKLMLDQEKISAEDAMSVFEKTMGAVTMKTSDYYLANKERVEALFSGSILATCDRLVPMYEIKFEKAPADVELMKQISAALGEKCADSEIYVKVSTALDKAEPSAESAYGLARMFSERNSASEAAKYYQLAIDRETDTEKKARYHYELASIQVKQGNLGAAKSNAQRAASLRPNWGYPHLLLGDLVATTKDCGDNELSQKSVFWLAVDRYQHAKSVDPSISSEANSRISNYSKYFPGTETIFFYGLKEGQEYTVPCTGEKTKVRLP